VRLRSRVRKKDNRPSDEVRRSRSRITIRGRETRSVYAESVDWNRFTDGF
jgi:hypothetical protein